MVQPISTDDDGAARRPYDAKRAEDAVASC